MRAHAEHAGLPLRHPAMLLATWFGIGLLPRAPGTWGSLAALPFAWGISLLGGVGGLALAALILFALGCWAADVVVHAGGVRDPGFVVVDEVVAQWLVLAVAPRDLVAYALGFVLFRIADITKPWPASWADRTVHGGLGIMLDDVLAGLYAGLALLLITRVGYA